MHIIEQIKKDVETLKTIFVADIRQASLISAFVYLKDRCESDVNLKHSVKTNYSNDGVEWSCSAVGVSIYYEVNDEDEITYFNWN